MGVIWDSKPLRLWREDRDKTLVSAIMAIEQTISFVKVFCEWRLYRDEKELLVAGCVVADLDAVLEDLRMMLEEEKQGKEISE